MHRVPFVGLGGTQTAQRGMEGSIALPDNSKRHPSCRLARLPACGILQPRPAHSAGRPLGRQHEGHCRPGPTRPHPRPGARPRLTAPAPAGWPGDTHPSSVPGPRWRGSCRGRGRGSAGGPGGGCRPPPGRVGTTSWSGPTPVGDGRPPRQETGGTLGRVQRADLAVVLGCGESPGSGRGRLRGAVPGAQPVEVAGQFRRAGHQAVVGGGALQRFRKDGARREARLGPPFHRLGQDRVQRGRERREDCRRGREVRGAQPGDG
jgi:hypothetical protein